MTPHRQDGDTLYFSSVVVFVFEHMATISFHWVEFLPSIKESRVCTSAAVNCTEEVLKENLRKKEGVVVCCVATSCTTEIVQRKKKKKRTSAEMNHMSMSKACWQIPKTASPSLVRTDFRQIFLGSTRHLKLE